MIHAVRHRGPDGFGYYQDGPVGFAHARLSVIDLATGNQPIANEDRTVWTILNGEIFNYLELRADLERRGHRFRTRSDTETIVHAYEEYGDCFVDRLNGQFAIALWDSRRRRLLLARDRAGIRPLFYASHDRTLLFASELKSLKAIGFPLRLAPRGLAQTFTLWAPVGAQTTFAGVESLEPGCVLVADESGRHHTQRYWQWSFPPAGRPGCDTFDASRERLRDLLVDAVRLQLRADVPVGAYLSGGLDSSGIVALIRRYTSNPVRTFSVVFDSEEFDESRYQQRMVQYLGTHHSTVSCSPRDIGASFPRFIWHAEAPVLRTAAVPLMMLSGLVRQQGYRVALTGEGADEVFGGYDLFKEAKIRRFWARQPESAWRPALLRRLYPYLKHSPVGIAGNARPVFGNRLTDVAHPAYGHLTRWQATRRMGAFLSAELRSAIDRQTPEADLIARLPPGAMEWDGLSRDQFLEVETLLQGYLLSSQGDRVAMANSIEGRFPFLDHRVIEFANALPATYKLRGLREKAILRAALNDLLPREVLGRVKQPYRAPDSASFFVDQTPLAYVRELLGPCALKDAGYFEPAAVGRLVEKCRAGRAVGFGDNMAFVGILSTMLVHQMFVRGRTVEHFG